MAQREFDHEQALAALRAYQAAKGAYEGLTGRSANDDDDLWWRIDSRVDDGELICSAEDAMKVMYATHTTVQYNDEVGNMAEFAYFDYVGRADEALEQAGLVKPDDDETVYDDEEAEV